MARCKGATTHSQTAARPRRANDDADKATRIDLSYLCQRSWAALNAEFCVAELTVAGVGGRQPLLQAALVHCAQGSCAVAGRQQTLTAAAFMANAANGTITDNNINKKNNVFRQLQMQIRNSFNQNMAPYGVKAPGSHDHKLDVL